MREARLVFLGSPVPPSGERGVLERPPPGPARGGIAAPGVAVVLVTLAYYALRLRKARSR